MTPELLEYFIGKLRDHFLTTKETKITVSLIHSPAIGKWLIVYTEHTKERSELRVACFTGRDLKTNWIL